MRAVLPIAALLYGLATVLVLTRLKATTPYAEWPLGAGTGIGTLAAGSVGWLDRRTAPGVLVAVAGACWLTPVWYAWDGTPEWGRSLTLAAAPFTLVLVAHLAVRRSPVIAVGYVATAGYAMVMMLAYDPFYDRDCWQFCGHRGLHMAPHVAKNAETAWTWFAAAFAAAAAWVAVARLLRSTPRERRNHGPLTAAGVVAVLALGAHPVLAQPASPGDPRHGEMTAVFLGQAIGLGSVALALFGSVLTAYLRRSAVHRLVHELGAAPAPGSLEGVLRRVTGDQRLTVAYRLASYGRYADASGRAIAESPAPGQTSTSIVRNGHQVAVVRHDPGGRELAERIGAATRLAIDNERLRAEILAHLAGLRASRVRVVTVSDETRRRLERDLHDGAQQSLLALCYELRLAGHPGLEEAQTALQELRELAHGIFPAVLDQAGLEPALQTLADEAPVPMEIEDVPKVRLPHAVENTIYLVVRRAIESADAPLLVCVRATGDVVHLRVQGAAEITDIHLIDRVGALGGRLRSRAQHLDVHIPMKG